MHAQERQERLPALVGFARAAIANGAATRDALAAIALRLEELAALNHLWSESEFRAPTEQERQRLYLVSEEVDRSFAIYLSMMRPGARVPPHNHTTWACIAAVEGCEHNYLYRRVDDGSTPGRAHLEETEAVRCEPGRTMHFLPDDIHGIANVDSPLTRHLHLYGRALEVLDERLIFDLAAGTCKKMTMVIPSIR